MSTSGRGDSYRGGHSYQGVGGSYHGSRDSYHDGADGGDSYHSGHGNHRDGGNSYQSGDGGGFKGSSDGYGGRGDGSRDGRSRDQSHRPPRYDAIVVCLPGLEEVVMDELKALGIKRVGRDSKGTVKAQLSPRQLYAANMFLRSATRFCSPVRTSRMTE